MIIIFPCIQGALSHKCEQHCKGNGPKIIILFYDNQMQYINEELEKTIYLSVCLLFSHFSILTQRRVKRFSYFHFRKQQIYEL